MKFFLLVLSWLLLFENLQGSTLSHGRPVRVLNTTLRTNFSGIYQRKNPCSGTDLEASSYRASHELHHHTRDDSWSDYTHKCSAIIRNFLQTIGSLIRLNHEPSGSFNFYLNTSISQKQRITGNHNSCESLPTIVIEATDCKIPLSPCCQTPKDRRVKYKDADDRRSRTDRFPNEEVLPPTDFPAQQHSGNQNAVPTPDDPCGAFPTEEAAFSDPLQYTTPAYPTQNPGNECSEAEGRSRDDDDLSIISSQSAPEIEFPTAFSPSTRLGGITESEGFSPAVLYDLSGNTQSAYEPKTKYFKTSLKLTPQTDPEDGTIQPRIHYMAANLVTDPSHSESAPQPDTENPLPHPGRPGPLMPIPFPDGPNHPPERTSPSRPPPPAVAPAFHSFANQNEPIQLSATAGPEPQFSLPSSRREPPPEVVEFSTPTDFQPQLPRLSNNPPTVFTPGDQAAVPQINDPQFSSTPLLSEPARPLNHLQEGPKMQFTPSAPSAPSPLDFSSRSTPPNSELDTTLSSESNSFSPDQNQSQDNLLPPLGQRPREDFPSQVPQAPSPNVNPEALNYPPALQRPPTSADSSFKSEPEPLPPFSDRTPNSWNQLNPPVPRNDQFDARQISPSYQRFPAQLPYDDRFRTTILPPRDSFGTYEEGTSLTTRAPSLEFRSKPLPKYSHLLPGEHKEESNGISVSPASQPSVTPYGAVLSPVPTASTPATGFASSDSSITSFPGPDERPAPLGSPTNFHFNSPNTFSGQKPTPDGQSTNQFHSTSVTTALEETVTFNQKQTTPGLALDEMPGRTPEATSNNFDPSSPSGSDFAPHAIPEQLPSAIPGYPQPQSPEGGPFIDGNLGDSQPLFNPDQLVSPQFQATPESPEAASKSPPDVFRSNIDRVQTTPETSRIIPMPFRQESQSPEPMLAPQYNPQTDGLLYMTTPMPYEQTPTPEKTALKSPVVAEGKPSSASTSSSSTAAVAVYTDAGLAMADAYAPSTQPTYPPGEYNFQTSSRQLFSTPEPLSADKPPVDEPLIRYSHQDGNRVPPASDSYVSGDDPTATAPQPFANNVDGLRAPATGSSLTYDSASLSQFRDSSQQGRPPVNFESSPPATRGYSNSPGPNQGWSGPLSADSENISGERNPEMILGSSERFSDGKETPLRSLSSDSLPYDSDPLNQYLPTSPSPDTFSGNADAAIPVDFLPSGSGSPTSGKPDFQESSPNSESFSSFSSRQLSPDSPADTSKPQLPTIPSAGSPVSLAPKSPYWNNEFDQTPSLSSLVTTSSAEDQSLPSQPVGAYAFSLPPITAGTESPTEYTLPPTLQAIEAGDLRKGSFTPPQPDSFTNDYPSAPESTPPVASLDESTQATPQQPLDPVPPRSIALQPQTRGLVIQTPPEAPEKLFDQNRPLPSETNSLQPFTSPRVAPAGEITPAAWKHSAKSELQYAEEETTTPFASQPQPPLPFGYQSSDDPIGTRPPQAIDDTSYPPQPDINGGPYPPTAFDPRAVESIANLQETAISTGRQPLATDPSSLPQLQKDLTPATTALNPDRFISPDGTQEPLPESTPAGEIITTQQPSFMHQPLNYADRSSVESSNSFVPLGSQQISTPDVQTRTTAVEQQTQSRQTSAPDLDSDPLLPSTLLVPTIAPETYLTYPDQPTAYGNINNFQPESVSPQQEPQTEVNPVYFSSTLPPSAAYESLTQNAESQTLSQVNSDSQERDERHPAVVNLQREPHPMPPLESNDGSISNSFNGHLPSAPRPPLPSRYPEDRMDYMQKPLPDLSGSSPLFYGQRPVLQTTDTQLMPSPPLNFSPKSELVGQQVTASEDTFHTPSEQSNALSNPDRQLATSAERPPAAVPPVYLHNPPNPNGPMSPMLHPRQIPNYEAFQPPEGQLRYFGPPPLSPYPGNNHPRLQIPNQSNFPLHPNLRREGAAPPRDVTLLDQRPVPPPMNRIINEGRIITPPENYPILRPNLDADPARVMDVLTERQRFRQQTEERPAVDSRLELPLRPETASRPYGLPPGPPTSPAARPPPGQENPLPNPLLQALQSHLIIPMQERPHQHTSLPGRQDQNEPPSFERKNDNQTDNIPVAPPYPGQWNPRPTANFVNLQQDAPFDAPRGVPNTPQPDPHALVPDQTTPSNEPGEDSVSYCERDNPLLCLFDPASEGNMTAPSYVILVSKFPVDADGEQSVRVEKVYLGGEPLLNCTWAEGKTFSTKLYTPVPSAAATTVTLRTKYDFP